MLEDHVVSSDKTIQGTNLMEELDAKTQLLEQHWEEFRQAQHKWQADKMEAQIKLDKEKLEIDNDKRGLIEEQKHVNEKMDWVNQEIEKLKIGRKELEEGEKALTTAEVALNETLMKLDEQKMKVKDEQERVIFERENLSGESDRIRDATIQLEVETEKVAECWKQLKAAEEKAAATSKALDEREAALFMAQDPSMNITVDMYGKLEEEILVAKRTAEEYRIAKEMLEKDFQSYKSSHKKDFEEKAKLESKILELQTKLELAKKRQENEKMSRKRAELGINEDGSTKKSNRKRIRKISESDNDEETTFPAEDDVLLLNAAGSTMEVETTTVSKPPKPVMELNPVDQASASNFCSKSQVVLDDTTTVAESDSVDHNPSENEKQTNNSASASSPKYYDPVSCSVCGKSCFNLSTLKRHSLLHMPSQETRQFPCKRCGRKFTRKDNCRAHYKKKFVCS